METKELEMISDFFAKVKFTKKCYLELRVCHLGESPYLILTTTAICLAAEAYVLPWFGRQRTIVNEEGYSVVKIYP